MLDQKYWLSKEQIDELSDEEKREFHNACADFIRYDLGINAVPGSWQIPPGEIEKKFIPRPWKEYQENPVSEKLHQEWKDTGAFMTGVAGILGRVFHRPDKKDYFLAEYDVDNSIGIREFLAWKSWKTIDVLASKTLVLQHADKLEDSLHFLAYKKDNPFVNKGSDVTKSDANVPSFEVHCVGRLMMGPGTKHRNGYPYTIVGSSATVSDPFIDEPGNEGEGLEEYGNNICIKYGLNPYLYDYGNNSTGNNGYSNDNSDYSNSDSNRRYSDNTPLSDEIKQMISTLKCDPKVQILKDTRHNTLLKIADSILFRYYDEFDVRLGLTDLHDFFVLINTNCCKPELEKGEREQIWRDAVEFVSRKKASESTKVLSISQALREESGRGKIVRGIIASVSTPFKVYTKLSFKCVDCLAVNEAVNVHATPGMPIIYSNLDTYKPQRCIKDTDEDDENNPHRAVTLFFKCEEESKSTEGRIIKIQNTDFTKNTDDTLEVLLTGDDIDGVRAGETVTIHGSLHNTSSLLLPPSKNRKIIAVMRCNTITYEGRQNLDISEKDIEIFKRFANYDKIDVITRLINYTAPQVIGEEIKKLGGLIGIVGGVEKEGQRGRIHVLYIGSMGLAKTLLVLEFVKMTPNARFLTIDTSSAKSALGIVERENEVTTLIYGPIPLCSGSIIALDEIQQWGFDDQGNLRSVMEEGSFTLLRYGKNRPIIARTTIFATMNPQDIVYTNRTKISKDEVTMVRPILDRFDLMFVSLDNRTEEDDRKHVKGRFNSRRKRTTKPFDYQFLTKYLLYAKTIEPEWTDEAEAMLSEFWVQARKDKKLGLGNRQFETILRVAEAIAKLRLKTVIDTSIAEQTMDFYRSMVLEQGGLMDNIEDPRIVAIDSIVDHIRSLQAPITFDALVEWVCLFKPVVKTWLFGGRENVRVSTATSANNKKYRELHTRFLQRIQHAESRVIMTSMKPLTVVWQTAKTTEVGSSNDGGVDIQTETKIEVPLKPDKHTSAVTTSTNNLIDPIDLFDQIESASKRDFPTEDQDKTQSIIDKQQIYANENESNKANRSNRNDERPTYEYLEHTNTYRCNWCQNIFLDQTKDNNVSHPCNSRTWNQVVGIDGNVSNGGVNVGMGNEVN